MLLNRNFCLGSLLLVGVWSVVGNAWWWHFRHVSEDYESALLYRTNNCLDPASVLAEKKVDDCHARRHTIDRGTYMAASEDLLRGALNSLKLAIWTDFLNESVVKLVFSLFGLAAAAGVFGLLMVIQRDLATKTKTLLPNHQHAE